MKAMTLNFREDINRYKKFSDSKSISSLRLFFSYYGLQALLIYRLGCWLGSIRRVPLYWPLFLLLLPFQILLTGYIRLAYDIHIERSADIGPGLYIGHFGGIHLHHCKLGAQCSVAQEVHIGPLDKGGAGPVIGNRVWVGALARVEGGVRVGDGATIGAGALVTQDVPEGCLSMGNPARILRRNFDNSGIL